MRLAAKTAQCWKCKQWKPAEDFPPRYDWRPGRPVSIASRRPICRVCFASRRATLRSKPSRLAPVRPAEADLPLFQQPPPHSAQHVVTTPADLRAWIARSGLKHYAVAAAAKMHPGTLGRFLNGHRQLTPEMALRIMSAANTIVRGRA